MNVNHFSAEKPLNCEDLGLIVLNSDGSIAQSTGELENDNKTALIVSKMIDFIHSYESINPSDGHFNCITIQSEGHSYSIQISKKSTIIKRKMDSIMTSIDT